MIVMWKVVKKNLGVCVYKFKNYFNLVWKLYVFKISEIWILVEELYLNIVVCIVMLVLRCLSKKDYFFFKFKMYY